MDSTTPEVYDLLILVDATYSMSSYLTSLQTSLPQIIHISTLTDCFARIGLLAYRDYAARSVLDWSGWMSPSGRDIEKVDLIDFAKRLGTGPGGDWPEATKTGLARAYELMRKEATTIVLLYADAPPHTLANGSVTDIHSYLGPELKALNDAKSYGGYGLYFADWVSASKQMAGHVGDRKAQVFCVLEQGMCPNESNYYNYISTVTNGSCFFMNDSTPATISKVTVEVLLAWMGVEKVGTAEKPGIPAFMSRYISLDGIDSIKSEIDSAADKFFFATSAGKTSSSERTSWNVAQVPATADILKLHLPKKTSPVQDFAKRYNLDQDYKKLAVDLVRRIIGDDVVAISINPVFGSLWRAICNDRNNEARDEMITAFGLQVDRIVNHDEKARMKSWLEESYDYTAEVTEAIESVPEAQRFPCVCLDPTQVFTIDAGPEDDDEGNKPITDVQRDELLEIGRSCDYKILRRLGRVLTRLTYINSAADMPAHIAAASQTEIPRIPMALAESEYKRKFWKILLHIVIPGTMLSARPAALLAALAIRLGVKPLLEAADSEMLLWRDRWNNLEILETWNMSCLGLLMDADKAYRKRKGVNGNAEVSESMRFRGLEGDRKMASVGYTFTDFSKAKTLLKPEDLALFDRLVSYKMLELNLTTSLTAQIAWTPEKTKVALGPTVICRTCEYPRSVTIMGAEGKCGNCLFGQFATPEERQQAITAHVTKDDNENTLATWVECNIRTCRAQYVVYQIERLNVKPKCHYCRQNAKAPVIECCECLNRVIWPESYRSGDMKGFKCYACTSGRKTTVTEETTARLLSLENSNDWLLRNEGKIAEPFNGLSLFHTISKAGTEDFCKKVELFPNSAERELLFHGKVVRNVLAIVRELESWVNRRRTESGTCSLCFSSIRKSDLLLACGRSGCTQRICKSCLEGWYGLNAPGRIINTAALSCPFCRRNPAAKTLAKYGMGIHTVGNLRSAVEEKGEWIYAWCARCGYAKQYTERVCVVGAPEELKDWACETCQDFKGDDKRIKKCPGCGVMTEKASGCDHITCSVPGCDTHWCFYCGKRCDPYEIYNHMFTEHGGYYGGVAAEDVDWTDAETDGE